MNLGGLMQQCERLFPRVAQKHADWYPVLLYMYIFTLQGVHLKSLNYSHLPQVQRMQRQRYCHNPDLQFSQHAPFGFNVYLL